MKTWIYRKKPKIVQPTKKDAAKVIQEFEEIIKKKERYSMTSLLPR